ncbi:MAG: lipid-A-disaccharide synthase [Proteobacteria bacterium]|nr:MAG: lipid-A-disaccharide synthase [Pseudomonadota bacterium]
MGVKKVAISVGELSGDEHAAHVIRALSRISPEVTVKGMGGRNLRDAGADTVVDSEVSASVMGFADVLLSAPKILSTYGRMKTLLREWQPGVLILVDYPDFNLRLARYAKSLGIRVLYFITPQLWAWRSGRVELFRRYVDQAAVIFPFERQFFEERGYKGAVYVGHPFSDTIKRESPESEISFKKDFSIEHGLDPHRPIVALFPGSRRHELKRHLAPILEGAKLLQAKHNQVQFVLAASPSLSSSGFLESASLPSNLRIVTSNSLGVLRVSDAAVLKSGTSNLQAAFLGVPFVMFYKASPLSEWIVRSFVKVREFSIVNVIESGTVNELLQQEAEPQAVSANLERLLFDQAAREKMVRDFGSIRELLAKYDEASGLTGCQGYAERVARMVLQ